MSEKPLLSVIVPTYNVEKYARTCFDSLLRQTLQNIEIILVDDGSTDTSGQICDEYAEKDPRVKVIHQTNRGLGLTRNSGLDVATGEYVGFIDSDDYAHREMFETLYENAKSCQADLSYCTYRKFSSDEPPAEEPLNKPELKIWQGEAAIRSYLLDRVGCQPEQKSDVLYGISVCCGIFSKKLLDRISARFVSERQFISEDMLFDIDVISQCRTVVHCDIPLYDYRYNPASLTSVYRADRFQKNIILHHEMKRRLEALYSREEYFNSLSRYLLTTARIAVIQEERFAGRNGRKTARENIRKICTQEEIVSTLQEYPYRSMPKKQALFFEFMRRSNVTALMMLCRLNRLL